MISPVLLYLLLKKHMTVGKWVLLKEGCQGLFLRRPLEKAHAALHCLKWGKHYWKNYRRDSQWSNLERHWRSSSSNPNPWFFRWEQGGLMKFRYLSKVTHLINKSNKTRKRVKSNPRSFLTHPLPWVLNSCFPIVSLQSPHLQPHPFRNSKKRYRERAGWSGRRRGLQLGRGSVPTFFPEIYLPWLGSVNKTLGICAFLTPRTAWERESTDGMIWL